MNLLVVEVLRSSNIRTYRNRRIASYVSSVGILGDSKSYLHRIYVVTSRHAEKLQKRIVRTI
jgi:hypothetical protein